MAFNKSVFAQLGAPSVDLTLAQGEHKVDLKICFDMTAIGLVKQKLGINMFDKDELTLVPPSDWTTILWAGLQRHQPEINLDMVGMVVNPGNYQLIVQKCIEAFTITLPKAVADPKPEPTAEPVAAQ